jgi:hypothetical protein
VGTGASVRVRFYSSIAFIPTGAKLATDAPDVPMTDGTADSVLAVLPRAYKPSMLASPPVPTQPEFNPGAGKTHEAHYLMLKIPAGLVGATGTGEGASEVVIPVWPPGNDTDVYDITIEGVGSGTGRLQYSGFGSVASILDGALTDPPTPTKPSAAAATGAAALARMTLGPGWKLTVPTQPEPPPTGTLNFLQCPGSGACTQPVQASVPTSSVPTRPYALFVEAESPAVTGPVAIRVSNGSSIVLRQPLTAAAGAPISFKVLHAPLSEMYGGTMSGQALHHFKLFYLLADPIRRPYYYPALSHATMPSVVLSDPFCTPVAQFKSR